MYPDFQHLLQSIFGIEMPAWLGLFKTFGALVALSFVAAAYVLTSELKRKEKLGLFQPQYKTIVLGKPIPISEIIISAITGFLMGYKIGGVFGHLEQVSPDPMGYLLSFNGNLIVALIVATLLAGLKFFEGKKQELPTPVEKTYAIYPHDLVMELVVVAAIGGIIGAKIFNALETYKDIHSLNDLIINLTSSSGLTFWGGLILAFILFVLFAKRNKIHFPYLADASSPAVLLAYGIGRLGCQLSGDGDWGIYNTAYIADKAGAAKMVAAMPEDKAYIAHIIGNRASVYFPAPNWLPDWLFGMVYPHNVANEGRALANCSGDFCNVLPVSVFPTPIYETIACVVLFFILWTFRTKLNKPLQMTAMYFIVAGIERFLVELIRVNFKYDLGFIQPTQAEIISIFLVLTGISILIFYKEKPKSKIKITDNMETH